MVFPQGRPRGREYQHDDLNLAWPVSLAVTTSVEASRCGKACCCNLAFVARPGVAGNCRLEAHLQSGVLSTGDAQSQSSPTLSPPSKSQLMSPFSKGETGLGCWHLPPPSPRPMCPTAPWTLKLCIVKVLPGPLMPGWRWVGSGPRLITEPEAP